jgi:hypothetical protein
MNVRSEPEVRPALDPGEPARSLTSKVTCETPKNPKQAPQRRLHFGVSVTGRWRSQESRLSNTGVPKSRNAKPRNRETGASLEVSATRSFGYREIEMSQTLVIRSPEVPKCEIPKTRNRRTTRSIEYRDFGYREMEMSETLINRSPEIAKCKMAK